MISEPTVLLDPSKIRELRPKLAEGLIQRDVDGVVVAWGPDAPLPRLVGGTTALLLPFFDGSVSVDDLIEDVTDALDLSAENGRAVVFEAIRTAWAGHLIERPVVPDASRDTQRASLPPPDW